MCRRQMQEASPFYAMVPTWNNKILARKPKQVKISAETRKQELSLKEKQKDRQC